jgi:SAM-dependent methyltransferase
VHVSSDIARQHRYLAVLAELGHPLEPGAVVLDFGCGAGHGVKNFRKLGYRAFGTDIHSTFEIDGLEDAEGPVFRLIEAAPYRLPFADDSFDFVYSEGVFEHVRNYSEAFAEIHRVLKPGSVSIHLFPARWRVLEGHVWVPFAGAIKNRTWLLLWALLGVRNEFQKGMAPREVAERNYIYLREDCTYYSVPEIYKLASEAFDGHVSFVELVVAKNQPGPSHHLYPLLRRFPVLVRLIRHFHMRALFLRK